MSNKLKTAVQELDAAKAALGELLYGQFTRQDEIRYLQARLPGLRDNVRRALEQEAGVSFYRFMELLQS